MSQTLDAVDNFHGGASSSPYDAKGSPTPSCSAQPAGPDSRCPTKRTP